LIHRAREKWGGLKESLLARARPKRRTVFLQFKAELNLSAVEDVSTGDGGETKRKTELGDPTEKKPSIKDAGVRE